MKYVRTYVARYYEHNPKQIHVEIQEQIKWAMFIFFLFLLQIHALLTIHTIFYFHSGLKIKKLNSKKKEKELKGKKTLT